MYVGIYRHIHSESTYSIEDMDSIHIFKGCARCGQREFVHRAVVPPILAPQKPAS